MLAFTSTLLAALSVVLTVVFALGQRQGPARCPEGLVGHATRCCGLGQRESAGHCVGRALACAESQTLTADGCVAPPKHVALPGGKALDGLIFREIQSSSPCHEKFPTDRSFRIVYSDCRATRRGHACRMQASGSTAYHCDHSGFMHG